MTWKKNWSGRLLWVCQLGMAALLLGGVCSVFLDKYGIAEKYPISPYKNQLVWLGISEVLFLLVSLLVFILFRLAAGRLPDKNRKESTKRVIEILLFTGLLSGGVLYRLYLFPEILESNAYFELGAVTSTAGVEPLAHGALYLYVLLLRGLFKMVGNSLTAGIVLQLVLQFLTAGFLYAAVRKIAGIFSALAVFGFFMFTPTLVKSSLSYTPEVGYLLLFSVVFWVLSLALEMLKKTETFKWYHYSLFCVLGIGIAFLIYLDVLGLVLLVSGFALFGLKKRKNPVGFAVLFLSTLFGLTGMFALDALQSGSPFDKILSAWKWLFCPIEGISFWELYFPFLERLGESFPACLLLFFGLFMGLYGFLVKTEEERLRIGILFALSGVLLSYDCPAAGNMDRGFLGILGLIILAVSGVWTALFAGMQTENVAENVTDSIAEDVESDALGEAVFTQDDTVEKDAEESGLEKKEFGEIPRQKEIKYIENPLPLPKKHVKKKMDYAFEVSEEELEFDFEIVENDDFDF